MYRYLVFPIHNSRTNILINKFPVEVYFKIGRFVKIKILNKFVVKIFFNISSLFIIYKKIVCIRIKYLKFN